jgi:hypothetical protein
MDALRPGWDAQFVSASLADDTTSQQRHQLLLLVSGWRSAASVWPDSRWGYSIADNGEKFFLSPKSLDLLRHVR